MPPGYLRPRLAGARALWCRQTDGAGRLLREGLLLLLGILGTSAHLVITWSLRFAPSATLAPMQYLEIPMATLVGYAIFGELPDGLAALGIAVTICAGLYVLWREGRASAVPTVPPVP